MTNTIPESTKLFLAATYRETAGITMDDVDEVLHINTSIRSFIGVKTGVTSLRKKISDLKEGEQFKNILNVKDILLRRHMTKAYLTTYGTFSRGNRTFPILLLYTGPVGVEDSLKDRDNYMVVPESLLNIFHEKLEWRSFAQTMSSTDVELVTRSIGKRTFTSPQVDIRHVARSWAMSKGGKAFFEEKPELARKQRRGTGGGTTKKRAPRTKKKGVPSILDYDQPERTTSVALTDDQLEALGLGIREHDLNAGRNRHVPAEMMLARPRTDAFHASETEADSGLFDPTLFINATVAANPSIDVFEDLARTLVRKHHVARNEETHITDELLRNRTLCNDAKEAGLAHVQSLLFLATSK